VLLRRASLALAVAAFVGPPSFGWWLMQRDTQAMTARGFICGNPLIGDALVAVLLAGVLSMAALLVGAIAFRRLPVPRPRRRVFELLAVSLPLLLAAGLTAAMMTGLF
jgi:hypothetical protein